MIVVPALLSLLVTLFCLLARPTRDEAEQAALLPFADDLPDARPGVFRPSASSQGLFS